MNDDTSDCDRSVTCVRATYDSASDSVRWGRRVERLRQRARRLYDLRDLDLTLGEAGRAYRVALPRDPDAPLDAFAAPQAGPPSLGRVERRSGTGRVRNAGRPELRAAANEARRALAAGEHMPYWGLLWPSGLALAEALLTSPNLPPPSLTGKELPSEDAAVWDALLPFESGRREGLRALELGCGLGVTATAALDVGLSLWAADCFPEAVTFCRCNTLRNVGRMPRTAVLDWRTQMGRAACQALGRFDAVLAADVLYEERDIAPLLDLAPQLLGPGGTFWLAEPGRRVSRAFVLAARARGWLDAETVYERAWPPDGDVVRVAVHRFTGLAANG